MNDKILLILPTRGRPWAALEAIASVMKTADWPSRISIVMCCDDDDNNHCYVSHHSPYIATEIGHRKPFAQWVGSVVGWPIMDEEFSWWGWIGDDVRFRTPGWDTLLREHKHLVVYGNDLYLNKPSHPFISTVIPKALGFLIPPELKHFCADGFIWALAGELQEIVHDPRIVTEHLHPDAGKAEMDDTYRESKQYWEGDLKAFDGEIRPRIAEWAQKVRDYRKQQPFP